MERCDHCPADPKATCVAVARNHVRYCHLTNPEGPDFNPEYIHIVDSESSPSPGLLAMGVSLAKAIVRHVATGAHIASDEVKAEREATCRACPRHLPDTDQCGLCRCNLKYKRAMASEACLDNPPRWLAV